MPDNTPIRIKSDAPELANVEFGFSAYARAISDLIANKENETPLVVGIFGSWGSGKTTLMEAVKGNFENDTYTDTEIYRKCKTVWFQAWKYKDEDAILAALIDTIFKTMKRDNFLEKSKAAIEELITQLKPFKAFGKLAEKATGINFTDYFSDMAYTSKLGFYDTFQDFFDRLLWTYTHLRPKLTSEEDPDDQKGALVIFIDDLDRCPQERIVHVLETIKLFMDKKGCVFVIGADNGIIVKALEKNYEKEDAIRFMDKIVHVTFNLPQVHEDDFKPYISTHFSEISKEISPHIPLIIPAMQNNPRQLKRFLNNLNLQAGILKHKEIQLDFNDLVYWSIIEYVSPVLVDEIKENPNVFSTIREHIDRIGTQIDGKSLQDISDEDLKDVPRSIHSHIRDRRLREIFRQFSADEEGIRQLIALRGITESAEDTTRIAADRPTAGFDEMTEISAGGFLYGGNKAGIAIDKAYSIDIYPVTNHQCRKFIQAAGYTTDDYWSEEGLAWRNKENVKQPQFWNDPKWNKPGHPVVGVSWYEAEAYANWAGKRIPTEIEWERASRGTDGRAYPWGDTFDKEKCNTRESEIHSTTRVTRYPNGVSPDGCYDMAGNVWEWTSSDYDEDTKVVRGGSWDFNQRGARCVTRAGFHPVNGVNIVGFRCVRT